MTEAVLYGLAKPLIMRGSMVERFERWTCNLRSLIQVSL